MNNYLTSIEIYKNKKTKLNYFTIPVTPLKGYEQWGKYKSCVGPTVFCFKKMKNFFKEYKFVNLKKEFKKVSFQIVYFSELDLAEVEKEILPKINKWLSFRLLFKPTFKRFLNKRIKRILQEKH